MQLRSCIFIILAFGLMFVFFPSIAVWVNNKFALPVYDYMVLKIIGAILALTGLSVVGHCVYILFVRTGQDLPLPPVRAPEKFVVAGLYRFVRNPMYLSYFVIIMAEFFIFGHVLILAWLALVILTAHLGVVLFEEQNLRRKFGREYVAYTEKAPRWLPL
ncbi:MAG: isoprenylcysteine carboxylmethyltransferase family protein [Lentisphaerae bacterium]|nr:isoprenylcysteine carboxylmethyltransferase family protein [Lentisphaerota bacterium]